MDPISIRFPMIKQKTGYSRGPRYVRVPDGTGLDGAAFCASRCVKLAILSRVASAHPHPGDEAGKIDRVAMRMHALWARLLAGQIKDADPRIDEAQILHRALVRAYCTQPAAA